MAPTNQCVKCGSFNGGKSKYRWFVKNGVKCCGCCGAIVKKN